MTSPAICADHNSSTNKKNRFNCSGTFLLLLMFACAAGVGVAQPVSPGLHINEVESNGGTPGDWFELFNSGASTVDVSGWKMKDNDDSHAFYIFPAGTAIPSGGYLVVEEAQFVFGLGAADGVRIFDATGALYESYSWTAHATVTYGRCPNGTGSFSDTATSTKGAANDCGGALLHINEVESNGGTPGDWFELINTGTVPADLSGWKMKDNDDTHAFYIFPAGTSIPAGGYLVVEEAQFVFGLGAFLTPLLVVALLRKFSLSTTLIILASFAIVPVLLGLGVNWDARALNPEGAKTVAGGLAELLTSPIVWLCCLAFFFHVPIEAAVATWATTLMTNKGVKEGIASTLLSVFWLTFMGSRLIAALTLAKGWDTTLGEQYDVGGIPFVLLVDGDTGEILATEKDLRGPGLSEFVGKKLAKKKEVTNAK